MAQSGEPRKGEVALSFDPAARADAGVAFIGHIATPWRKGDCPKNLREARMRGGQFTLYINMPYRQGLAGLQAGQPIIVLLWMDQARRNLICQHPSHRAEPAGTFALRSPVRPNPVALSVVTLIDLDRENGVLTIDASDAFDGTPVIDIKPWLASVDIPASAAATNAATQLADTRPWDAG